MKAFNLVLLGSIFNLFTTNVNPVEKTIDKEIIINTQVDLYNKNIERKDLKKVDDKYIFEADNAAQLIFSKEQSSYISNPYNEIQYIGISYSLDIISHSSYHYSVEQTFDEIMHPSSIMVNPQSIYEDVLFGTKEHMILHNLKDSKTALQVKPFVEMKTKNRLDISYFAYYHFFISKIRVVVKCHFIDLSGVSLKPIVIEFTKKELSEMDLKHKIEQELRKATKLLTLSETKVIDAHKTVKPLHIDQINFDVDNRLYLDLVPSEPRITIGSGRAEIILRNKRNDFTKLNDIKEVKSNELDRLIYDSYVDYDKLDIEIDLSAKRIRFKDKDKLIHFAKFINNGPLNSDVNYRSLKIIKDDTVVAEFNGQIWNIIDKTNFDNLIKIEERPKRETEQDNIEEEQENNVEEHVIDKQPEKKKSKSLKLLWLLAIPFTLGISSLLTWLIPFIKRKK